MDCWTNILRIFPTEQKDINQKIEEDKTAERDETWKVHNLRLQVIRSSKAVTAVHFFVSECSSKQ